MKQLCIILLCVAVLSVWAVPVLAEDLETQLSNAKQELNIQKLIQENLNLKYQLVTAKAEELKNEYVKSDIRVKELEAKVKELMDQIKADKTPKETP